MGAAEEGPLALSPACEWVRRRRDTRRGPETGTVWLEAGGKPPGRWPLTSTRRPMLAMCGEQSLTVSSFSICKGTRLSQSAGRRPPGLHRTCSPGGRATGSPARGSQAVGPAQGQRPVSRAVSGPQHSPPRLHGRRALARLQALISQVSLRGARQQRPCLAVTGVGGGANNANPRRQTGDPRLRPQGRLAQGHTGGEGRACPDQRCAHSPACILSAPAEGAVPPGERVARKGCTPSIQAAFHMRPAAVETLHKTPRLAISRPSPCLPLCHACRGNTVLFSRLPVTHLSILLPLK